MLKKKEKSNPSIQKEKNELPNKVMKIYSTSLEIRGKQIQSTVRYHSHHRNGGSSSLTIPSLAKDVKQELLRTAGESVDWNNHFGGKLGTMQES